jgi:hypothetical protein
MNLSTFLLSLMFVLSARAAPPPARTNAPLPSAYYDLAELVFRQYMSSDSKCVFVLAYGTNSTALPPEFMARFKAQSSPVRGNPESITVISNKIVLDKITGQETVGLDIREIRVTGDTAEIQVIYFASNTGNSTRFSLVRGGGKWRVKERKAEWVADTF